MDGFIFTADAMEPIRHARKNSYASARSQAPLRLLSLDGGGVRGYSMILLLEELMVKLFVEMEGRAPKPEEIPKPCDHFDLIGGTGTGGLIAILIGRLRLDLEACKWVYTEMTRRVFETDKTIAGLPYRKTLFKASKLEEAIKEVVRDVTTREPDDNYTDNLHLCPRTPPASIKGTPTLSSYTDSSESGRDSLSVRYSSTLKCGNENALLYDHRPNRCKTLVTAVYKGSEETAPPAILRTYDSQTCAAHAPKCSIWEAGRATSATFPAFKPIQIGQSIFLDEGTGRFSPVAQVLEEAIVNEWPGRPVGLLLSIGSGKRPEMSSSSGKPRKDAAHTIISATPLGKFQEAREKHIAKVRDCEDIHQELLQGIHRTGVSRDNYIRLNVEVGVGDFGMNEWRCLAEISNYTKSYLARPDVQTMNHEAAEKLAQVWRRGRMTPVSVASKERKHSFNTDVLNRDLPKLPPDAELTGSGSETDEEIARNTDEVNRIERMIRT